MCTVVTVISSWILITEPGNSLAVMGMLAVNVATFVLIFYLVMFCVLPEAYGLLFMSTSQGGMEYRDNNPPKGDI